MNTRGECRSISPLCRRGANAPGCNSYIIQPGRRGAFFVRVGSQRSGTWSGLDAPISSRTDSSGIEDGSAALARQERRGGVFCPLRTACRRLSASLWSRDSSAEAPALEAVGRWSNFVKFGRFVQSAVSSAGLIGVGLGRIWSTGKANCPNSV